MAIIEKLLSSTNDIWKSYNLHPFVSGLENGTLDKEKFKYYIIQDYLYLQDYLKVFAIGIAKAKSAETVSLFSNYVTVLTSSEMDIHRAYMHKLGITQQEIGTAKCALDNLSYTSYMLRVAYEESEAEILTAVLSCAYSYEVIAKNIVKNNPSSVNHEFYGQWVCGYITEEYAKENQNLISVLEKLTKNYSDEQISHLIDIFTACSRYELEFWNMAWNKSI